MISDVDLFQQVAEQIELGGNFGAADDRRHRARRSVEHLLEGFQFGLQRSPGIGRQHVGQPFGRGVRAVRHRESVIDENVAQFGQRGDEFGVVLFLAGMEAGVFQADDVAGLHRGDRALGRFADAIVDEFDRALDDVRDLGGDRLERLLRIAPLGAAEMRQQDHLGALVGDLGDGGRHALDARCVADDAVLNRDVQVDAHQHALSLHVDVVKGAERAHGLAQTGSVRSTCPSPRRCPPCG